MSALKDTDTNIYQSEKQTLIRFLGLYTFLALLIVILGSTIYYKLQKDLMLQTKRLELVEFSKELIDGLKLLHIYFDRYRTYPRNPLYRSAIYDADKVQIFSTLKDNENVNLDKVIYTTDKAIHYIHILDSYYLGAKYVVVEIDNNGKWFIQTWKDIFIYSSLLLILFLLAGIVLVRLFLAPMRNAINLLDRFIKDTTHELNTPVNAILSNIEMIDKEKLDPKLEKKIRRIEIAARTISNIYQDLTYLILHHKIASQNQEIDISQLIKERIDYFKILADSKNILIKTDIKLNIKLYIDKGKFTRLFDNLLSNAIKYNKRGGEIFIFLEEGKLIVKDSGKGMNEKEIKEAFSRYKRFDTTVGGFGIGLNIVSLIAKEYNLNIKIDSQKGKGSEVIIRWDDYI
ncbi:HAMP domain-containing sensor histidine kinase [Hydrogenimonas thermophila]|uniref:sensor histidine kinase n=1 Tax=Hydrogenimonas thermophila TaxID=223786 RepID=UPI002937201A|nr:HAMP domain-containing sensor histidine kinase [Hydrogenimonas thermophila]WOE70658.1 HAMP domain-containing sensor histidine kinase [Hydrogenimonas thermophila]WOE73176.1 HAMP domain-containing sensor histidine kinase [Hydrogenimonas thermophila]